jgi:hypothetical protein
MLKTISNFLQTIFTGKPLFLTPFLTKGKWKEAQKMAKVDSQVFGPKVEDVESYAGYFTVNTPECNSNLFFWYFPAEVSYNKIKLLFKIIFKIIFQNLTHKNTGIYSTLPDAILLDAAPPYLTLLDATRRYHSLLNVPSRKRPNPLTNPPSR